MAALPETAVLRFNGSKKMSIGILTKRSVRLGKMTSTRGWPFASIASSKHPAFQMQAALRVRHVVARPKQLRGIGTSRTLLAKSYRDLPADSQKFQLSSQVPDDFLSRDFLGQHKNIVFTSTSLDPFTNLAIENELLTRSDPSSRILFFYRNKPCVVIGRNQNPWVECHLKKLKEGVSLEENANKDEVELIRRRSGGGAVFHDQGNLNYSVIVPNDSHFSRALYPNLVVRALQSTVEDLDVKVNDRNDIVIQRDGKWLKISGSAFKLTRGRAMAHGTLLFASPHLQKISALLRSPGKGYIKAKGVESVRSAVGNIWNTPVDRETSAIRLIYSITRTWIEEYRSKKPSLFRGKLQGEAESIIQNGKKELLSLDWRYHQTPGFEVTINSVDCGGIEMRIEVKSGIVQTVNVKHAHKTEDDSSQAMLAEHLSKRLRGLNLVEVSDWKRLLTTDDVGDGFQVPQALISRMETIFPNLQTFEPSEGLTRSKSPASDSYVSRDWGSLKALRQDGGLEIEDDDQNTIRELRPGVRLGPNE